MKYETCMCIIGIFVLVSLLWAGTTSAKDYSVVAGNWHVAFSTNDTVYTKVDWNEPKNISDTGYYTIWVNEDPGITTRSSAIFLYDMPNPTPLQKTWMETYMKGLLSPFNKTPLMSSYTIDGKEGMVGEGWADQYGRVVYSAEYPVDPNEYLATKLLALLSLLDKTTSYEIINSLHAEYSGTQASGPQPTQPTQASYTPQATGTRDDPVPIGTAVNLGNGWVIQVLNVYPDATNMVLKENQFNDAPKPGDQFFLATVQVKYVGEGSSTFSSYDLRSVGPSSVGYSTFQNSAGVIPDPLPSSEVFTGGKVTGNVGWEISSSDANGLVMYYTPLIGGNSQGRMYMALYGPGLSSPATSYFGNEDWAAKGTGKMGRGW